MLAAGLAAGLAGCGTPGAPSPPSLNLPGRVADLAAVRTGNQVSLAWTMPKKNTDKLLLKGNVSAFICRKEEANACIPAGGDLQFAPGSEGAFTETLPAALAAGKPRVLSYFVELKNRNGRSAGLSNAAVVLAGEAPGSVDGLVANVRKSGVVLSWKPDNATQNTAGSAVRLHRKLLTMSATKPKEGLLAPEPEALDQSLLVDSASPTGRAPDRVLDKEIRFGRVYEYRAQRVARITVDGQSLELAGPLSEPVRVEAMDVFPPAVPSGLDAVATDNENGAETAIDLSWQPDTEADLAGYVVYRAEGEGAWQRISPAQPVAAPGFHDTHVQSGHTYRYAVSAIDQGGHESARSAETQETVPTP